MATRFSYDHCMQARRELIRQFIATPADAVREDWTGLGLGLTERYFVLQRIKTFSMAGIERLQVLRAVHA